MGRLIATVDRDLVIPDTETFPDNLVLERFQGALALDPQEWRALAIGGNDRVANVHARDRQFWIFGATFKKGKPADVTRGHAPKGHRDRVVRVDTAVSHGMKETPRR